MMMADSFGRSAVARQHEFQTAAGDSPLVAQFAARNAAEFAASAELVAPHVDGIDLNCGCPQRWAVQEGIGAVLLDDAAAQWETVVDMISQARSRTNGVPISIKMRVLADEQLTVEMARCFERAGVAWIAVHGRTRAQRPSDPVNADLIRLVKESVGVPVIANGNVFSLADAEDLQRRTGVDGVMAARGLLENPALFAGHDRTPRAAIDEFVRLSVAYGTASPIFHHHLSTMSKGVLSPPEHRTLNSLSTACIPTMLDFLASVSA